MAHSSAAAPEAATPLLVVEHLSTRFGTGPSAVVPVRDVGFSVGRGEVVAIVGESGSGKSVTMAGILGLLRRTGGEVIAGSALFEGRDLLTMSERELRRVRGDQISMIFQDPGSSFNPVLTVGRQIAEAVRVHNRSLSRAGVRARVLELLREVHITDPETRMGQFPHEFSGGMLQRAMIAMAMVNRPRLVIADETTTALDVTIQAQILQLLDRLRRESGSSVVLVTHDLGVVAEIADRVVVMYAGSVVESAPVDQIFNAPRHPYTVGLLASRPRTSTRLTRLYSIPGQPPVVQGPARGCLFEPRCSLGRGRATCVESIPPLVPYAPDHDAACHFADQVNSGPAERIDSGVSDEQ